VLLHPVNVRLQGGVNGSDILDDSGSLRPRDRVLRPLAVVLGVPPKEHMPAVYDKILSVLVQKTRGREIFVCSSSAPLLTCPSAPKPTPTGPVKLVIRFAADWIELHFAKFPSVAAIFTSLFHRFSDQEIEAKFRSRELKLYLRNATALYTGISTDSHDVLPEHIDGRQRILCAGVYQVAAKQS
jgi:hypothetical protein